jgi:hypothetical protein
MGQKGDHIETDSSSFFTKLNDGISDNLARYC